MAEFVVNDEQFGKAFEKAVSKALQEMGASVQTAVLYHLERVQGISATELMKNPEIFSDALQKIFATGTSIIEEKILQVMCRDLGVEYEKTQGTFVQKLQLIQRAASSRQTALLLN